MKHLSPLFFVAAALAGASATAYAADGTWITDGNGNWSDTTKWSGGTIADGTGAVANFNTLDLTGNRTVTLDSNRTVGTINFGDTGATNDSAWTISGSGTLNLATTTGGPVINLGTPNAPSSPGYVQHTISSKITGNQGLTINATSAVGNVAMLSLSGDLTGLSGALTINGGRVFTGTGATGLLGGLTSVAVNAGGQLGINNASYNQAISLAGTGAGETGFEVALRATAASGAVTLNGAVTLTGNAAIGSRGAVMTFTNAIGETGGARSLSFGTYYDVGKLLTGTIILGGANTYTGATTVKHGTLLVNGSLSAASAVTVSNLLGQAATLGGTGTVGATTVNGNITGGAVDTVGTLNTGALTLNATAAYLAQIDSGAGLADKLDVTGLLTLGGKLTLNDLGALSAVLGTKLTLASYDNITGSFTNAADGSIITVGSNQWKLAYNDASFANTMTLTAVPEPGTYGLIGAGALATLAFARRRRRKA